MKKERGNWGLVAVCGDVQARQRSVKKTRGRWLVLLACTWSGVCWNFPSVAFADYYTATISCWSINSPGASMYSVTVKVDQCTGSMGVDVGKIVFSDTIYYPVVTITKHRSDGTIFVQSYPIRYLGSPMVYYSDNCNLLITGDPSCLPESVNYTSNPAPGKPDCPQAPLN